MGTRSSINILNADGSVSSMYCHWDGYIEHHGPILLGHYNTEEKVRELFALDSLSVLGENIGEKHDFDNDHKKAMANKWCVSHLRDREEPPSLRQCTIDTIPGEEYDYLFRDGRWFVRDNSSGDEWKDLAVEAVALKLDYEQQ